MSMLMMTTLMAVTPLLLDFRLRASVGSREFEYELVRQSDNRNFCSDSTDKIQPKISKTSDL
jgi:hypothetical protein